MASASYQRGYRKGIRTIIEAMKKATDKIDDTELAYHAIWDVIDKYVQQYPKEEDKRHERNSA